MAFSHPRNPFTVFIFISLTCITMVSLSDQTQVDDTPTAAINLITDALEYWPSTMSLYDGDGDGGIDIVDGMASRRSLFWKRLRRYYISYGALSANRIPCPPRSGRSYYTHNCFAASGPAHPYTRGCSAITRCRR